MKLARAKHPQDLTICTFLWGDWYGLGPTYLKNLYEGVKRNLDQPFRFICYARETYLGNMIKSNIEFIPISISWRRNLNKLVMYSFNSKLTGRVIALDLDMVIVGGLSEIVSYRGEFITTESLNCPGKIGGSVIGFKAGYGYDTLWTPMNKNPKGLGDKYRGSERWYYRDQIKKYDLWSKLYPGQIVHYENCKKGIPKNARIIYCTGSPKPHQIEDRKIKEIWVNSTASNG